MTQALDSLPARFTDRILCRHANFTRKIQIVRIVNISGWYFERVVFPTESIWFEALPEAQLEVHTTRLAQPIMLERTVCARLRICEEINIYGPLFSLENLTEPALIAADLVNQV